MKNHTINSDRDGQNPSIWQTTEKLSFNKEQFDTAAVYDTLVIGGGITGITTALLLQEQGQKCILAEGHTIGFGTTGGTTAHLNSFFDSPYPQVEKDFGEDNARLLARAGTETLAFVKNMVDKYQIDCDFFYNDAYLYAEDEKQESELKDILTASRKAGINLVENEETCVPVPFRSALLIKNQAQFHPLKYINALAKAFVAAGGIIMENTFIKKTSSDNGVQIAESDTTSIKANNIVYATHIPPGINVLHFRCAPYRSYVIGFTLEDDNYPDGLAYDMQEPYHYFRSQEIDGQKYLILGGEDHKTGHGDPEASFANLESYARQYYRIRSIDFKWSSQYYEPADGLPYIGPLPGFNENTYVATGYSGNGMTYGSLSAMILRDQILGRENPYSDLFKPSRIKPVAGFMEFVKENADVAYRFVADRINAEELSTLAQIPLDSGQVVEYNDQKLAVYKSAEGKVSALSPTCTHAGCIVNFNAEEKSWDCPCHGGRFDLHGNVLTGPPRENLQKIALD